MPLVENGSISAIVEPLNGSKYRLPTAPHSPFSLHHSSFDTLYYWLAPREGGTLPRPRQTDVWSQAAFYASLGFIIPMTAVAGYALGSFLDRHLGTGIVLAVVGSMLGAAAGIVEVIRLLTRKEKSDGNRSDNDESR